MSSRVKAALFAFAALFGCSSMRADFITISQPNAAYINSTTLLDFTDPDFTAVGFLSGGGETLTYDSLLEEHTVPTNWTSWNNPPAVETSTPRVGWTGAYANDPSELTITLSRAATTFGFEVGPDLMIPEETTADFYSGSKLVGTIDLFPSGNNGALLFAATSHTDPFTSVVINNLNGDDFAIARQRFQLAAVPEPGSFALLGLPLAALFAFKRARRS
ncbi:MAG TPA: hypothetical protein VKX25_09515 [Bryobacteraceae bacterium]|jgi:hypothetical protein|nr:hypothetical protein [Bryobacteraceae bacterium]